MMRNRNLGATTKAEGRFKMLLTFQNSGLLGQAAGREWRSLMAVPKLEKPRAEAHACQDTVSQTAPIIPTEVIVC
jgi:hypothetical protein